MTRPVTSCASRLRRALGVAALLLAAGLAPAALPARAADSAAAWDLSDLYASPAAWARSHERTRQQVDTLARFKGTLGRSAPALLAALGAISDARREVIR